MLSFRPLASTTSPPPSSLEQLIPLLTHLWQPAHFYVAGGLRLAWQFEAEQTLSWEVFRGHLLDPAQTREQRRFLSWNVFQVENGQLASVPMLSLLVDPDDLTIHVTRGLLCHVWQPTLTGSVVEAEETTRWVRELVGSVSLADFGRMESLRDELIALIWQAVVGSSRLPLHSLEAPLPSYSLGQLAYIYRDSVEGPLDKPMRHWPELITQAWPLELSARERAKLLETLLRTVADADIADLATLLGDAAHELPRLLRAVFNNVSLSPYTDFVDHVLAFSRALVEQELWTPATEIDLIGHVLRLESRHLNAYDLIIFHHRGANYPDALLLDAMLQRLLSCTAENADLFAEEANRRQALLLGCLLRRQYEGLAVPTLPTSPGENARVMPWERVPEEEILEPIKRRRRLFEDKPLAAMMTPTVRAIVGAALQDLTQPERCRELGMALFIDRPLGYAKASAERDQTPLVAHECFSPSLMRRRFAEVERFAADLHLSAPPMGDAVVPDGIPIAHLAADPRPCASLADARKVTDDFVLQRTMLHGLRALFACFDMDRDWLNPGKRHSLVHFPGPDETLRLTLLQDGEPRIHITLDLSEGWTRRAGMEYPRAGIEIIREGERIRLRGMMDPTCKHEHPSPRGRGAGGEGPVSNVQQS